MCKAILRPTFTIVLIMMMMFKFLVLCVSVSFQKALHPDAGVTVLSRYCKTDP